MTDPRVHRRVQRYGWDLAVADYDEAWVPLLAQHAVACVDRLELAPGQAVLDVATGPGTAAFVAAERVGAGGRVVGLDVSEKMCERARAHAAARGLANTTFVRADMEKTGLPDASFDAVVCVLGLMFAADRDLAFRELRRVLRPGGRIAVCVWGRRAACGWAEVFPIVDRRVASEVCPLFFDLGVPGALVGALGRAGFREARDERVSVRLGWANERQACSAIFNGGAVALAYSKFSPEMRAEVHAEFLDSVAPFRAGDGFEVPGEFVYGVAVA